METIGGPRNDLRENDRRRYLLNCIRLQVMSNRQKLTCDNMRGEAVDANTGCEANS